MPAISFKPYRIIYSVSGKTVYALLIAAVHRDLQTLLQPRLLQE